MVPNLQGDEERVDPVLWNLISEHTTGVSINFGYNREPESYSEVIDFNKYADVTKLANVVDLESTD